MHFAWISNDAYAACARKFTFVCQPLQVSIVLPPAQATLPPAVQICEEVYVWVYVCVRVSIVIAAPFAQHLRLPTTTQVRYHYLAKAESQKLGPTIGSRLNALDCDQAGWSVGQSVRQLVRHSINQVTTDKEREREGDCRCGGILRGLSTNVRHLHFAFCICFAMWRI